MATVYDPVKPQQSSSDKTTIDKFPYPDDKPRIDKYTQYERLFFGHHFDAFRIQIDSESYSREYAKIRYVCVNFAGMLSKIIADLLFIEPPKIQVQDGDQKYLDALMSDNQLRIQNYESALANSYNGDAIYKIRTGQKSPYNKTLRVYIDQVSPNFYFPVVDPANVKGPPLRQELCWIMDINGSKYLRKEIHTPGYIENKLYLLEGSELEYTIKDQASLSLIDPSLKDRQETGIDRSLIVHIPNWRAGNRHFGTSDYYDLTSLFYAINNRISKIDNILDKHSDPILMVPPGVLDKDGNIKKKALGVIEVQDGEEGRPEYVVWDASLENAFKELDYLVSSTLMQSDTAPVLVGLDKGGTVESGRALKYKLIRTLAKAQRKQLYYREGLIETLYVAQHMAKAHKLEADGVKLTADPKKPEIIWSDGIPADMIEQVDVETKRVDAGLTSKKDAIMRLDDIDEDAAEKKVKEIDEETKLALPSMDLSKDANGFRGENTPKPGNQPPSVKN